MVLFFSFWLLEDELVLEQGWWCRWRGASGWSQEPAVHGPAAPDEG